MNIGSKYSDHFVNTLILYIIYLLELEISAYYITVLHSVNVYHENIDPLKSN